jgi:hypothetical protein
MADYYDNLTEGEQAYWDIYTRLRELSDWPGFTKEQAAVKTAARDWLQERRKDIWRLAQPEPKGDGNGWDHGDRRERYRQLRDESLNNGDCRRLCQLPTGGGTDREKALISEREMWWRVSSVNDETKAWRLANSDLLAEIRKQIYTVAEETTWDRYNRRPRWEHLCVATKTGKAYDRWAQDHNPVTGADKPDEPAAPGRPAGATSSRGRAVAHARSFLGVSERPSGSNRGSPQPSGWQKRVIGADGYPWCACFVTCMAWDAGVTGGSSAGVIVIVNMAQKHQGMFRGWTTDSSRARRGDFAVVSCTSCHIGMVASDDPCHLLEGNTSPGVEGSQFNGGCVAEKHRPRSQIVGWALVEYP